MEPSNATMKYISLKEYGKPSVLYVEEGPIPKPKEGEVIVKLVSSGLNRSDCNERAGKSLSSYGMSKVLGLEGSGYIIDENGNFDTSKPVMVLTNGGCYAQYVAVPKELVMEVPKGISVRDASAIPMAWLTAIQLINMTEPKEDDWVLIYGSSSGIGAALIQLLKKVYRAKVIAMADRDEKCATVRDLKADVVINSKETKDVEKVIRDATNDQGVNILFDCIGAFFFNQSLNSLAVDGKWAIYRFLGGSTLETLDMTPLLRKRITLSFCNLRSRPLAHKAELVNQLKKLLPNFENGDFKISIDAKYEVDWSNAECWQNAHCKIEAFKTIGKIVMAFKE